MTANKKRKDAHLWARDPDDWYVEPAWCDDALFASEKFEGPIVDPCCGLGRILDAAWRAGYPTVGYDIKDRGVRDRHPFAISDFFNSDALFPNVVCNPPYLHGDKFVRAALARSVKTAVLLRAQWANAGARSRWLESLPLRRVLMLTPRPSMPPGAVIIGSGGKDPSGGLQDYAWFIFERGYSGEPGFGWARREPRAKHRSSGDLFEAAP